MLVRAFKRFDFVQQVEHHPVEVDLVCRGQLCQQLGPKVGV